MRVQATIMALAATALLTACNTQAPDDAGGDDTGGDDVTVGVTPTPRADEPVSILRPDIEQPALPPPPLEPLNAIIGFPDGGDELDADAIAALEEVLASKQLASGAPVVLRGHSDAGGDGDPNMRASEARGLAVAAWLIENGVDEDRIEVIVFGEQNPAEPNALPDGSPNEAGRAANRRVEVLIVPAPLPDGGKLAPEPSDDETSGAVGD